VLHTPPSYESDTVIYSSSKQQVLQDMRTRAECFGTALRLEVTERQKKGP